MPEPQMIAFSFQELATALVKEAGIHEGHWGILVRFGLNATNVGSSSQDLRPAAVVALSEMGLQRFPEPSNLTVDAAVVNPPKKPPRTRKK